MPKEADDWYSGRHGCIKARSTKLDRGAAQKENKKTQAASEARAMRTRKAEEVQRHQTDAADHICWEIWEEHNGKQAGTERLLMED